MWNILDITCPKDDLFEFSVEEETTLEMLRDFVTFLTTSADTLTSENPLWNEMKILQNIQAKYKRILHCDKCLLYLHRVGQCLKKMVLLNLSRSYLDLAERFLVALEGSSKTLQLPSCQQIEYILIRTQSAAKLASEVIKHSREVFCFLIQKLKVGHMILDLVMAASVTARINVMVKAILIKLCDIYRSVFPWQNILKKGPFQWPSNFNLPEDLQSWLEETDSELLRSKPMSESDTKLISSLLSQTNDSDNDSITLLDNDIVEIKSTVASTESSDDDDCHIVDIKMKNNDYGEVISRETQGSNNCVENQTFHLTEDQTEILQRIMSVRTLKSLKNIWKEIINNYRVRLPLFLTVGKMKKINNQLKKLETHIKKTEQKEKKRRIITNFVRMFMVSLGFTEDHRKTYETEHNSDSQLSLTQLKPVKTLKKLKTLFQQLCDILTASNELVMLKKLKKIFKRRLTDIRLLKKSDEKLTAKNLIFCTSKVLITLCQKIKM